MTQKILRTGHMKNIRGLLRDFPIVALIGARQVGKTTLARDIMDTWPETTHFFDLEDPADIARLSEPSLALRNLQGLVVIDKIQRVPGLFPVLRVLADRADFGTLFLVLGSASPRLVSQSSESLAGRIAYYDLPGLTMEETGIETMDSLWLRGGFPRSFLARSDRSSLKWRREFIKTFLERDIPQLGINIPAVTLRRFWTMLAHYHGQMLNLSELGRAFGLADTTIRRYIELMESTFVIHLLHPWHANIKKRQVKAPKVYITDSGLLHALLDVMDRDHLMSHPKAGASWEGFALQQVVVATGAEKDRCFFWRTHTGAELDLLIHSRGKRYGFEIKLSDSPGITPSMKSALRDLELEHLYVIHAGEHEFPLGERISAIPMKKVTTGLIPLNLV